MCGISVTDCAAVPSCSALDNRPGMFDGVIFSHIGAVGIFFVARKQEESTGGVVPQQGMWTEHWFTRRSRQTGTESTAVPGAPTDRNVGNLESLVHEAANQAGQLPTPRDGLASRTKRLLRWYPTVWQFLVSARQKIPVGKWPPRIARY